MTAPAGASRWLVASDLDQTLIYSRRAFRLVPDAGVPPLRTVEHYDGGPASFLTARAGALLDDLARSTELVPVTTRTLEQYRRIDLGTATQYAVAANGGHLLCDGVPDPGWEESVRRRLATGGRPLTEVLATARALADPDWVRTVRVADDYFVYLVAHDRSAIPDLTGVAGQLEAGGWTLSVQGRKVYLVPAGLTKQAALAEVAARTGRDRIVAAGDSLLDAGMLAAADVAVRPAHGELHDAGWHRPHLRVTEAAGLYGGEQVVEALCSIAADVGPVR